MELRLPARALASLQAHAEEGYPHEVVGLLAGRRGDWTVVEAIALHNERADSPRNRYQVSGLLLLRAEQAVEARGLEVVGYYHTHPDHPATYSDFDRDHALPDMIYPILSVIEGKAGELLAWRLRDDRSAMDPVPVHLLPSVEP